jgi:hypothetical protein
MRAFSLQHRELLLARTGTFFAQSAAINSFIDPDRRFESGVCSAAAAGIAFAIVPRI